MTRAIRRSVVSAIAVAATVCVGLAQGQPPAGAPGQGGAPGRAGGRGGPARPVFSVTSTGWPDGGEIPMKHAFRGENKSPAFEFHWSLGLTPATAPDTLQSYAVIFHDIENATNRGPSTTLHWAAFNIPGTAKGLPEGLAPGDLPDGTRNGPGLSMNPNFGGRAGGPGSYFGPGAGPGPFHHYVFEFYALDAKLDLPAATTREDLLKAMESHVIGKAAYIGRFRTPTP